MPIAHVSTSHYECDQCGKTEEVDVMGDTRPWTGLVRSGEESRILCSWGCVADHAKAHGVPLIQFKKGERKDDVMAAELKRFQKSKGVVFIGKAQEKTPVFRTERRRKPDSGLYYILSSATTARWARTRSVK